MARTSVAALLFFALLERSVSQPIADSLYSQKASPDATPYVLAGAAVTTAILIANDQQIHDDVIDWKRRSPLLQDLSPKVTLVGSYGVPAAFSGLLAYGYLTKRGKEMRVGILGLESFVVTGIAGQVVKRLLSRERPFVATRPGGFWHGPSLYFRKPADPNTQSYDSFPSGHTTSAFSAAATLSDEYDTPWLTYTSYTVATLVAISRVMENMHWASDCVAGAVLGIYGAKFVRHLNNSYSSINILPRADAAGYGLILCIRM